MKEYKLIYLILFCAFIFIGCIIYIITDLPDEKPKIIERNLIEDVTTTSAISETNSIVEVTQSKDSTSIQENDKDANNNINVTEITTQIVNLNTAGLNELTQLPEITEELAKKIIELRKKIDHFNHPYELLYVDGISEKILNEIIDYVVI